MGEDQVSGHGFKPDECDACSWVTDNLTEMDAYARTLGHGPFTPDNEKEWAWLCSVCMSTASGTAHLYPRHRDDAEVLSMLAWGINAILDALKTRPSVPSD
jgi:hypothetical protein